MKRTTIISILLLCICLPGRGVDSAEGTFPGLRSDWNGYDRYDFTVNGREAIVVTPRYQAPGKPWIWRPAFFGAFPSVDIAMLGKGYHVVYYDLTHLYGSPRSVALGEAFYHEMVNFYGLAPRVVVEGFSRGGLFAVNWAAKNPDKTACVYLDAPVCDVFSWPGRGRGDLWRELLSEWGMTDQDMDRFPGNPVDNLAPVAAAGIPIIGVCGDADAVVPYEENLKVLEERYRRLGGDIEVIVKPGVDHHPHSLDDPSPVVDYILKNT